MAEEVRLPIATETDILAARQQGRELAGRLGFSASELALLATAISEVARNIVQYAQRGEIVLHLVEGSRRRMVVIARDDGPGIADINPAMQDGYSTGGGLGLGLPGAKRLMEVLTSSPRSAKALAWA